MQAISLIVVPYELGRLRQGVGCGPELLLKHGAQAALAAHGATVETRLVALDDAFNASGSGEADAAFELIRQTAAAVASACAHGAFPVVLAGSCFTAVGTVAGLGRPAPGAVWLDAHPDFSEPSTTTSGYFDSMGLSVLTGSAWRALLDTVPGARALPEASVILAGARSFDASEKARLGASRIVRLTPADLATPEKLLTAVANLPAASSGLYVHIDFDVLDAEVAMVNVFSVPGGIDGEQLDALLHALMKTAQVRAVTLSAYDPAADHEVRVPSIANRLLRTIAGALSPVGQQVTPGSGRGM